MEIEKIKSALAELKHPEINMSLMDLGMIGKITSKGNEAEVTLKVPVAGIPILQMLIDMIKEKVNSKLKIYVEVNVEVMNESEKERFMKLAQENWAL